jgi:hypothetical protein
MVEKKVSKAKQQFRWLYYNVAFLILNHHSKGCSALWINFCVVALIVFLNLSILLPVQFGSKGLGIIALATTLKMHDLHILCKFYTDDFDTTVPWVDIHCIIMYCISGILLSKCAWLPFLCMYAHFLATGYVAWRLPQSLPCFFIVKLHYLFPHQTR